MTNKILSRSLFIIIAVLMVVGSAHSYHYKTHALSAKLAAELVKRLDAVKKRYAEIYLSIFVIQLGTGAWEEDNGNFAGNNRAMRHYYDPDCKDKKKGVPYYRHYKLWKYLQKGTEVTEPSGGRYAGALEWARNGAVDNWSNANPFNWEGAIRAYDYTASSRAEAYYRLGHVLHLLTDMAEPDHALNIPHAGSSMGLPDTIDDIIGQSMADAIMEYMKSLKGSKESEDKLAWLFFVKKIKQLAFKSRRLGYELLVDDYIHPKFVKEFFQGKDEIHLIKSKTTWDTLPPIQGKHQLELNKFDDFFNSLAGWSKLAVSDKKKYPIPLGIEELGNYFGWKDILYFGEPIYLIPAIDMSVEAEKERNKYYALAWKLLEKATEYNANLLMHFYDIVNPPPYVKEVTVSQEVNVKYRAYWEDEYGQPEGNLNSKDPHLNYNIVKKRELKNVANRGIMHEKKATIKIVFGPNIGVPENIDKESVKVTIGGTSVLGSIKSDRDPNIWEGTFPVPKLKEDEDKKTLQISIAAGDADMHWTVGPIPGSTLDSNPYTPAKVSYMGPGQFHWVGHESATASEKWDTNHKIRVVKEEVQPNFIMRIVSVHKDEDGMLEGQVWLKIEGDIEHLEIMEADNWYINNNNAKENQRIHTIKIGDRIEEKFEYPQNRVANHVEQTNSFWGITSLRKESRSALVFSWGIRPGETRSLKFKGIDGKGNIHVAEEVFVYGDWIPDPEYDGLYKRREKIK